MFRFAAVFGLSGGQICRVFRIGSIIAISFFLVGSASGFAGNEAPSTALPPPERGLALDWRAEHVDAPRTFLNMGPRSLAVGPNGVEHLAYGGDHSLLCLQRWGRLVGAGGCRPGLEHRARHFTRRGFQQQGAYQLLRCAHRRGTLRHQQERFVGGQVAEIPTDSILIHGRRWRWTPEACRTSSTPCRARRLNTSTRRRTGAGAARSGRLRAVREIPEPRHRQRQQGSCPVLQPVG